MNETSRSSAQDWLGGARWSNIIELLPAAVYVCDAPSGIITYYNPRAAELWGRAPAIGDTDERFCGTFRLYRPDGSPLPHDQTPMAQVLGGAPPARNQEIVIERPDGSRITVAVNIDPIKDADGKTVGAINVFQDVSQEKRLSEALQQSEERLRLATQTGKLGIWDWDIVANRISWSQSLYAIHGLSPDRFDATVDAFAALVHPDDRERVSRAIQKAIADDAPYELEFRILRPDGKITWVFTHATVMRLGGRAVRMIGATMDITERKRMERALRESEQKLRVQARELEQQLIASDRLVALGEVTASMAHELNNPLGIIIGFIEDMLSGKKPSDPDFRALRIIDEESQRCKKIIADLMEYARPRSAEMSSTDVPVLIEKTLNLVENHLYKQKIEAVKEIPADLPKIHADSQQLAQVLVNLFLNAIDAMPQGGRLKVGAKTVKESKEPIVIEVADSGQGIEGSELAKIFKPFYTAKKRRGLGLGLPICERIVKNHGGRLEVDSVLNHGTTFRIYLPLRQEATKG